MIPSDALCASLCEATYSPTASIEQWDHFDPGLIDGVCWGLKRIDGFDIIALRGSAIFQDWVRDLRAGPMLTRIGHVHEGFHQGMEQAWTDIRGVLKQPVIITGHSLGAARASILTALMIVDGTIPVARVVFGEPKPGFADHAKIVVSVPGRSYRNGDGIHHDLVTDVPFSFPPLEYTRASPIIPVSDPPPADDQWGAFSYHHIQLYFGALSALKPQETAA